MSAEPGRAAPVIAGGLATTHCAQTTGRHAPALPSNTRRPAILQY
jgi:hypothetical protein